MALTSIVFALPSAKVDTPYSMSFAKRLARGLEAQGVRVHLHRVVKSADPRAFVRQGMALRRPVQTTGAQLVVAQFGTYTGLLTALFCPPPVIVTFRGSDLNPEPQTPRPVQWAQHAFSHAASWLSHGIVCVSRQLADRVRVRRPMAVIPSPTDMELFAPRDRAQCRAALGWPADRRIAVFLPGSNPALKGIDLAREIQERLRERGSPVHLEIVADQRPLDEVPLYLNAADALVFLSRFEGSPNLVRDACACNLPVVTTDVGDVRDVLSGVVPSAIVPRNADRVIGALELICAHPQRSNGREQVHKYATAATAARVLEFYQTVVTAWAARQAGR